MSGEPEKVERAILDSPVLRSLGEQGGLNLQLLVAGAKMAVGIFIETRRPGFHSTQHAIANVIRAINGERDDLAKRLEQLPDHYQDRLKECDGPHLDAFGPKGSPARVMAGINGAGLLVADPRPRKANKRVALGVALPSKGVPPNFDRIARKEDALRLVSLLAIYWKIAHRHRKQKYKVLPKAFRRGKPDHPFVVLLDAVFSTLNIHTDAISWCNEWQRMKGGKVTSKG